MNDKNVPLSTLGEFAVLNEVIFRAAKRYSLDVGLGDDCVYVDAGDLVLAMSADVGPRPLAQQLAGNSTDYESAGWHAAVATASDIATSGAAPLCMVDTIDAPADLLTGELDAFVDGYFRACAQFGFSCAGGDIRQGTSLVARVFGVGVVRHGVRIGRSGAAPGDRLVLLGAAGEFISAFLCAERTPEHERSLELMNTVRFPKVQLTEMQILTERHLVTAASDSSDGVLGSIANLMTRSDCGFRLTLTENLLSTSVRQEAAAGSYNPWNLFFHWGDWSVVATVRDDRFDEFKTVAAENKISWLELGSAVDGAPGIVAELDGQICPVNVVRNENFVAKGFNAGVRNHVEYMLTTQIFRPAL